MTATAFADDPILEPAPRPHTDRPVRLAPAPAAVTATAPLHDDWLRPSTGRPQLALIEGAGQVQVPVAHPDPMVEVYRRRRFAVALALTAVILLVTQLMGISLTSFGPAPQADESAPLVHVVRPGDTYPAIAATLGVDDPVDFAGQLRAANGSAELVVGQRLVVDLDALQAVG